MGTGRSASPAFITTTSNAHVHAYVARSDPNMGVRTGAKLSYFVDAKLATNPVGTSASCKHDNGEFDNGGSLIHRDGHPQRDCDGQGR